MGDATEPQQKRDWLDVVAPVKQDAVREAAGGLFLFANRASRNASAVIALVIAGVGYAARWFG
ncbi:hypothetical protein [Herbiconiux flava]|uniref:Uncharacterized protein n=1 Tax=Herbiconiux flava TaxID=881268 RepID=A0A852SSS5_9MICO|nr:hypothetical protein [Herbiconiux flava]NYD71907.1 hypothetical protein [Herbiconiux flava]GLK18130.1 hypothetical protein GCM10017602_26120 [Herbiconiux flava]